MRENNPGIYFIINLDNGKVYVGQTISLKTRLSGHFGLLRRGIHSNKPLQFSFNKHGEDCFYPYIAERCSMDSLTEREQFWIDFYPADRRYNVAPAAGSCFGITHSAETRAKVSAAKKGVKQPAHVRAAISLSNKTRIISDETRAKLADSARRRIASPETRKKLSDANKGRPLSTSQKQKLSIARSRKVNALGKTMTIVQWSEATGIPATAISRRLFCGWSEFDAVTKPKRGVPSC